MRPGRVSVSAAGNSAWFPVNYLALSFGIGLGFIPWSSASLICTVQHTFDDLADDGVEYRKPLAITRSATTATVVFPDHRASVGDSFEAQGTGNPTLDGFHDIASVVDANTFTYACANSGSTIGRANNTFGKILRVFPHAFLVSVSARADGNYFHGVTAIRLQCTSFTSGGADLLVIQGMGR